jgi:response regulator NasT
MKNALVVDDEALIRMQVKEVLENYGFDSIYEADNGTAGLKLARKHLPLVTVIDFSMPGINGIDAAKQMNKSPCGAIVLLTGVVDDSTIANAMKAGINQYLMKPFSSRQLGICVDLAINQFIQLSTLRDQVHKLEHTLETKETVARAKGYLIKQGMSEPAAHRKLQKLAMDKRKSLKDVAAAILNQGDV